MKEPKLKPCPFCGTGPFITLTDGYYRVVCPNQDCPSRLKASLNKRDIVTAWNTRLKPKRGTTNEHNQNS